MESTPLEKLLMFTALKVSQPYETKLYFLYFLTGFSRRKRVLCHTRTANHNSSRYAEFTGYVKSSLHSYSRTDTHMYSTVYPRFYF